MGHYTEKTQITFADYLKLQGLLVIGHRHYIEQEQICRAISEILGEDYDAHGGHATDAVWEGYSVDELLRESEIKVIPAPSPGEARRLAEKIASQLFVSGTDGKSIVIESSSGDAIDNIEEILRSGRG